MIKTIAPIAVVLAIAGEARADTRVHHVPPAGAEAATQLELAADAPSTAPALTVHYRTQGQIAFATAELVRQGETRWVVVVPPTAVVAPGLYRFSADVRTDALSTDEGVWFDIADADDPSRSSPARDRTTRLLRNASSRRCVFSSASATVNRGSTPRNTAAENVRSMSSARSAPSSSSSAE